MNSCKDIPDGIIAPLPTPLLDFNKVDIDGLSRLIEHVIAGGVSGISILGHTGEERCIDYRMRQIVISETCRAVDNRVPVFVSISDTSICESYMLAGNAAESGAAAMIFSPPYYLTTGQAELVEYYDELLKMVPLPVILYNIESIAQIKIEPQTILEIAQSPSVIGIKDSSADIIYLNRVIDLMKSSNNDFKVYSGKEEILYQSVLMGCDGGFFGGATLFPKLYLALYNAAKAENMARCRELQEIVMHINSIIYSVGHYHSSYLKGLKCVLNLMGIINDDYMAPPFHKFLSPEREKVKNALDVILSQKELWEKN